MPKATAAAQSILALILNATAWADIAENDATSPLTDLYLSLHTASPGIGGSQQTNEAAYTNYARVAVERSAGGWTVSGGVGENADLIQFPQCGVTGAALTHVAIGTDASGVGRVLYQGALNATLNVANLIQPQFSAGALTVTES